MSDDPTQSRNALLWATSKQISIQTVREITTQPWLHIGEVRGISAGGPPSTAEGIIDHLFYVLLIRVVAVLSCHIAGETGKKYFRSKDMNEKIINEIVPSEIQEELHSYVSFIISRYRDVHYHSMYHAYHVVISTNKLLDIALNDEKTDEHITTFGLRSDSILQIALIFSAIIHDVDHRGIANLTLVEEEDELAILYNDQSVAEQQSLAIAFRALAQPEYAKLKKALFPLAADYRLFRKTVINLVLSTDLASPVRTQIVKSKWKEAFGETPEQKVYKKILEKEINQSIVSNQKSSFLTKSSRSSLQESFDETNLNGTQGRQRTQSITSFFDRRSMSLGVYKSKLGANEGNLKDNTQHTDTDEGYVSMSPCESFSESSDTDDESQQEESKHLPQTLNVGNGRIMVSNDKEGLDDRSGTPVPKVAFIKDDEVNRRISCLSVPDQEAIIAAAQAMEDFPSDNSNHGRKSYLSTGNLPTKEKNVRDTTTRRYSDQIPSSAKKKSSKISIPHPFRRKSEKSKTNSLRSSFTTTDTKNPQDFDSDGRSIGSGKRSSDRKGLKSPRFLDENGSVSSNKSQNGNYLARRSSADTALKFSRRSSNETLRNFDIPYTRRRSAPLTSREYLRKGTSEVRLGIRRAMDLTGNPIELYPRSTHDAILKSVKKLEKLDVAEIEISDDEPDEFRASVVLETILRAADISANMQCWKVMLKWTAQLFYEQMEAFEAGRVASNPGTNWFENQISFLDNHVIPLGRRLEDCGVFGEHGQQFAAYAEENRRRWVEEGKDFTGWMFRRWNKIKQKKAEDSVH